ncbi:hypothetical protein EON80_00640 [bacterium]|nr:MAG: hypothetical protein EON80_00640 [bacterium]
MIYGLKNNYASGVQVSPGDLNRRADVLQSQLPGAFRAFGPGVFELDDLLVNSPTSGQISAGNALILNSDGILVYVQVPAAASIPVRDDELYLHLALRVPNAIGGPGDTAGTDSRRGAAPVFLLSENEEETDALLLASWDGTGWVDARTFSASAQMQQIQADIGYDATQRAKGSLASRLDALSAPIDPGSDGPTAAQFAALQGDLAAALVRIATLEAGLASLNSNEMGIDYPTELDQAFDEIAITRAGLAEVNPTAIERGQISVITANAGMGQFDGPVYSPTTGDPNELVYNPANGTFGA